MDDGNIIYFDNSSTTLIKPKEVGDAVRDSINSQAFANPSRGTYDMSVNSLRKIYTLRSELAEFFGIDEPLNIALTSNVTTALNLSLNSILASGDHVITSLAEHNSVLRPLYHLNNLGVEISFLPLTDKGEIDLSFLEKLIRPTTKAVVITHMSNVSGIVTNLQVVYDFCLMNNLYLIIDAAQSAGVINIKFNKGKYPKTIFCFTGHKGLYGPQGTGGIIRVGDFDLHEVFTGGGGNSKLKTLEEMPDIFEYGTINVHSNAGLLEGVRYVKKYGIEKIEKHNKDLAKYVYENLKNLTGAVLYNEIENNGGIVSFNYKNYASKKVSDYLWEKGQIATRPALHCAPLYHKAMGTYERGMVRVSFSTFNTKEEADQLLKILCEMK
ncbi:aminotransferase class V-fold PLP-dependent enzyme [Treponema phagedenis]|uniref:Putative cysteine desulfurase family protein n=1 Tax=Treponema phagedenis TaxID=162 RepID=A0A0B7GRC4_TREPH|nr:aminotransferase class V-fold PLP-dependent enzyme [Treponema phagedenis]EFW37479.1 putative cysteine desulfurase family protein [Treponema phagedenis F0421]CEM61164.1 putative cysteine desulfurase family protein [Treponema phagedenis]